MACVKKSARLFYITESNETDNQAISINEAEIFEAFAGYFANGKRSIRRDDILSKMLGGLDSIDKSLDEVKLEINALTWQQND